MTETERDLWLKYIAVLMLDSQSKNPWILSNGWSPDPFLVDKGADLREALGITIEEQYKTAQKLKAEIIEWEKQADLD